MKPERWAKITEDAQDFLRSLLEVDPKKRLTAELALKHPWVAKRDQSGRRYVTPLGELEESPERRLSLSVLNIDDGIVGALCSFAQASRFRRACMSLMAWSLTAEERSQVRDSFIELDVNRTGTIKLFEFKRLLMERFQVDETRTNSIIAALATTNNEVIHYSEFLAAMVSTRITLNDEHFQSTFRRFDTDSKGFLTSKDLKMVLGDAFSLEEVEQIVNSMDQGSCGEIRYEQFIKYLRPDDTDLEAEDSGLLRSRTNSKTSVPDTEGQAPATKKAAPKLIDLPDEDAPSRIISVNFAAKQSKDGDDQVRLLSPKVSNPTADSPEAPKSKGCSLQ